MRLGKISGRENRTLERLFGAKTRTRVKKRRGDTKMQPRPSSRLRKVLSGIRRSNEMLSKGLSRKVT